MNERTLFDEEIRYEKINKQGNPLERDNTKFCVNSLAEPVYNYPILSKLIKS